MNTSENSRDPTRSNNMKRGSPLSSVMLMPLSKRRKLTTDRVKTSSNPNQQSHRSPLGKDLPDPAQNHTPLQFLQELFHSMYGISLEVRPARELKDFFQPSSDEETAAYTTELLSVVRENNVLKLKQLKEEKNVNLRCRNQFGESLVHLCCRRGFAETFKFLLEEEGAPVRISDDCGRNPLHDTCWNATPQLEICQQLMERDPALFLVSDSRGFTPFDYARAQHWGTWKQFLLDHRHHLQALAQDRETLRRFSSLPVLNKLWKGTQY